MGPVLEGCRVKEKTGAGGLGDVFRAELEHGGLLRESYALHEIVPARVRT